MDVSVLNNVVKIYKGTADAYDQPFFKCHSILDLNYYEFTRSVTSLVLNFVLRMKGKMELQNGVTGDFQQVDIIYECAFTDLTIEGVAPYDFDAAHAALSAIFNPMSAAEVPTIYQVLLAGNNTGGLDIDMYGGEITNASLVDADMYNISGTPGVSATGATTITSVNGIITAAT